MPSRSSYPLFLSLFIQPLRHQLPTGYPTLLYFTAPPPSFRYQHPSLLHLHTSVLIFFNFVAFPRFVFGLLPSLLVTLPSSSYSPTMTAHGYHPSVALRPRNLFINCALCWGFIIARRDEGFHAEFRLVSDIRQGNAHSLHSSSIRLRVSALSSTEKVASASLYPLRVLAFSWYLPLSDRRNRARTF